MITEAKSTSLAEYNINCRLITVGNSAAGGFGGLHNLMKFLVVIESRKKSAYVGRTLAANPMSPAAGYYTILEIEKINACEIVGRAGDRLNKGLVASLRIYPYHL